RLRRRYGARVLNAIYALMLEQSFGLVPKSLLGKGLTYLRAQWPKLIRYAENGDWPISNNLSENAIRPFCVGRRCRNKAPSLTTVFGPIQTSTEFAGNYE